MAKIPWAKVRTTWSGTPITTTQTNPRAAVHREWVPIFLITLRRAGAQQRCPIDKVPVGSAYMSYPTRQRPQEPGIDRGPDLLVWRHFI